jgi:hypothetical protein
VQIGSAYWLRIRIGKLHNDRYIPLHPQLKELLDDWITHHRPTGLRTNRLLLEHNRPISHHRVTNALRHWPTPPESAAPPPISCATRWPPRPKCAELHRMHHSAARENVAAVSIWGFAAVAVVGRAFAGHAQWAALWSTSHPVDASGATLRHRIRPGAGRMRMP